MPAHVLAGWEEEIGQIPDTGRGSERARRIDRYLDSGMGQCWLSRPEIASLVQDSLRFAEGKWYTLFAWCVMPNHVHLLARFEEKPGVGETVGSIKKYTARRANLLLGRSGEFWFREYFDRYIRSEAHRLKTTEYILNNPVKAGLCTLPEEWLWSSAYPGNLPQSAALESGGPV